MKLSDYIKSLSESQQDAYASKCGTTGKYLRAHILHARKECRKPLREALAEHSDGNVSMHEVLQHFGIVPCDEPQTPGEAA